MTRNQWLIGAAVAASAIGGTLYLTGHAKAADLGGNCCADLEERVAELEATTARKGNRKVSLTLSGYVSHSVMAWDDGKLNDVYIGDGGAISSRFRFQGTAKINPSMSAGFLYEFGVNDNALGKMTQGAGGDDLGGAFLLRDSTVWLRHNGVGMVKIGFGSTATDNLILVDLSNASVIASPDVGLFNGSFQVRAGGSLTGLTWGQGANSGVSFDTARRNHVLYETPSLAGFTVQAAVGENNFWDVALRYAGEFGGFRMAGGIGHSVDEETPTFGPLSLTAAKLTDTKGSASVMHMNSGLFLSGAAGMRETDWSASFGGWTATAKDSHFWHLTGGIQKNWLGFGATTLYAEYHQATDMLGYEAKKGLNSASTESTLNMLGFGIVQKIDAADMDLFLAYKAFSGDASYKYGKSGGGIDANDFTAVIGGARINF
jgi:hypothetical protein